MLGGSWGRRLTSRATLGVRTEGTTWLNTTSSTSRPSTSLRKSSSRAAWRARVTALTSRKRGPLLANGVRTPATTATRLPPLVSAMLSREKEESIINWVSLPLTVFGNHTGYRAPMLGIDRFQGLTPV